MTNIFFCMLKTTECEGFFVGLLMSIPIAQTSIILDILGHIPLLEGVLDIDVLLFEKYIHCCLLGRVIRQWYNCPISNTTSFASLCMHIPSCEHKI